MKYEKELKLFVVLSRTMRDASDKAKANIKELGLNLSEFSALGLLYHKGPQRVQEISKKVLLTSGSMTYVLDNLATKGLVVRRPKQEDRRVIEAELTPQGETLMHEIFPTHAASIAAIFSALTPEEVDTLTGLLKKVSGR